MKVGKLFPFLLLLFCSITGLHAQSSKPDLVLQGKVSGVQNQTYFEIPFQVPSGVHRISVDFSYTGKDHKTTLDLGIADPERFRGNSGGNKSHFTIGESDATPSYLPGAIPPGRWKLLISVPNIRPNEQDEYRAEVTFNSPLEDQSFTLAPLESGKRWYRGDLHMHTAHSDGSCMSQSGKKVPCPLIFTVQDAVARGLDFIANSEHNTTSQYNDLRELQPYFDKLLFIPAREITTFWGHFNIFGTTQFVDYRATPDATHDVNAILRDVHAKGAIASINHADAPTGEICMGCGWTPRTPINMHLFNGIEVINGSRLVSTDFWDAQLAKGFRLAALGGSDNHNAQIPLTHAGSIGSPTTVVEADNLSVAAILKGIQNERTFVDVEGTHDRMIDLQAQDVVSGHESASAVMGQNLPARPSDSISIRVHVLACPQATLHLLLDGHEIPAFAPHAIASADDSPAFSWTADGRMHWLRAEVRDDHNALLLISSPIYINFPSDKEQP